MSITEKIDRITRMTPEYMHAELPAPKSVKIELSPRCNYRCQFCALRTRQEQPKHDMDWLLFQRITEEMREAGVEEIGVFYLGESFMNVDLLVNAIKWCKGVLGFPYVFLTTNGSLAKEEYVQECMSAGLDSLKWSVNACDAAQFEQIMGVSARWFDIAVKNIQDTFRMRERAGYHHCSISASSIQYDGAQQERMKAFLDKEIIPYVDTHYWLPLYGQMTHWTQERIEQLGYRPTAGNQGRIGALREPLPCWTAFTEGHVRADGHLSACCFSSDEKFDMADLTCTRFMDGWNSASFQRLRSAHLTKDVTGTICEGCLLY